MPSEEVEERDARESTVDPCKESAAVGAPEEEVSASPATAALASEPSFIFDGFDLALSDLAWSAALNYIATNGGRGRLGARFTGRR